MTKPHDELELGQFIPLHYHYHMLNDNTRVAGFKAAIEQVVHPGSRVLELGGGTGVLSFFAAQRGARVWCVERNPELAHEARKTLARNHFSGELEVIEADAFDYLPPEPVDVVICEMIHVAMLREKQIPCSPHSRNAIWKNSAARCRSSCRKPSFMRCSRCTSHSTSKATTPPHRCSRTPAQSKTAPGSWASRWFIRRAHYEDALPARCNWDGEITIERAGTLNALRFITKNILAILPDEHRSIDWHSQYLVIPLEEALQVEAGQKVRIRFDYAPGRPAGCAQAGGLTFLTPLMLKE